MVGMRATASCFTACVAGLPPRVGLPVSASLTARLTRAPLSISMWNQDMLNRFAKDIESGALVNRAVSEADTGSPTRAVNQLHMQRQYNVSMLYSLM
jgi:hypothetical protein